MECHLDLPGALLEQKQSQPDPRFLCLTLTPEALNAMQGRFQLLTRAEVEIRSFSGTSNLAEVPRVRALQAAMYISMRRLTKTETDFLHSSGFQIPKPGVGNAVIPLKPLRESASESYCQFDWNERAQISEANLQGWCL